MSGGPRNRVLNCGYVPLVDSAPLILAKELGFASDEGLRLNLLRQPSWSALRDLLALGHLDAAHMLAPMPAAMQLGLSGPPTEIVAPLVLSVNGTVIGVSSDLAGRLRDMGWDGRMHSPQTFAHSLGTVSNAPLRVGVPFPFSMHRLLFEYLMRAGGTQNAPVFDIVPTPPPLMADAVASGDIDIFCVGEPWGTVAVSAGVAELILPGSAIWAHAPEKVLGMRRNWAEMNDALAGRLIRAVYRAAEWLDKDENRPLAGEILARSEHLNLPDIAIDPALNGQIMPRLGGAPWDVPGFQKFHSEATSFPWRSLGAWIGLQISHLHGVDQEAAVKAGSASLRPDLFRRHLSDMHADMPGASAKVEGALHHATAVASTHGEMILGPDAFFDGKTFDFAGIS